MTTYAQHVRVYRALRGALGPLICRILGFSSPRCDTGPAACLVVSNHNTDYDPIFLGTAFTRHMYFVASEHVFRFGFLSRLLVGVFDPIARVKGTADAAAALSIIRRLRAGANVCLFAEGNRSFSGVTGPVFPATGKLVKTARAALVTYRIEGGYLASPRWSGARRRGPIRGNIVNVYSPEQLKAMTADEVNAAITRDLYEDAYSRQAARMETYRGKNLAEHLEYALYLCPNCGKIGALKSRGDRFFCACGLSVRYNEYGLFERDDGAPPFENVRDWDRFQEERMAALAAAAGEAPVFFDENVQLLRIGDGHEADCAAEGRLSISGTELRCGMQAFPLSAVTDMALCGATRIAFATDDGTPYELRADPPICGRKYETFFHKLKQTVHI